MMRLLLAAVAALTEVDKLASWLVLGLVLECPSPQERRVV